MKTGSSKRKTVPIVSLKMYRDGSVKKSCISNVDNVTETVRPLLCDSAIEKFILIGMDTSNSPTVIHINSGSQNQCGVFVSTAMKILLLSNSSGFIIAHNHPAGTMRASEDDWMVAKKFREAGKILDMELVDSIIYNADMTESVSMRNESRWFSR